MGENFSVKIIIIKSRQIWEENERKWFRTRRGIASHFDNSLFGRGFWTTEIQAAEYGEGIRAIAAQGTSEIPHCGGYEVNPLLPSRLRSHPPPVRINLSGARAPTTVAPCRALVIPVLGCDARVRDTEAELPLWSRVFVKMELLNFITIRPK